SFHVTGVQTCALPISKSCHSPFIREKTGAGTRLRFLASSIESHLRSGCGSCVARKIYVKAAGGCCAARRDAARPPLSARTGKQRDRKSTRLNSSHVKS